MEKIGEGESVERPMDLESSTSVEVNLEGLHLDTNIISTEQHTSLNVCKKRKPEESLDTQDPKSSNQRNEYEEILKKRKREDPKSMQESMTLKQATDELDLMCKIWVMELRRLPLDQQLFARKAVCDVLFEARLGQLNKDSVRINRSDVVQNYLACVHEEQGKLCACQNSREQLQQICPTSSLQLYPGHSHCYSKSTWKGFLSSPHRPPFFATNSNRFAAPNVMHYPRSPRIGRPIVITTAMNNITTTTIVVVTPRMIITTASSASVSNHVVTTTTPAPSKINTVNISPYRIENSTKTSTKVLTSYTAPLPNSPAGPALNSALNHIPNTASRSIDRTTIASTNSSILSNTNNPAISDLEPIVMNHQSTKPTVNTSTTPTVYTLCDVHMDTVTTDN